MTQLEEIDKLMGDYHKRTGHSASVSQYHDGRGHVCWASMTAEEKWTSPSEAMDVIRKALAPPPPTKEETLEALDQLEDALLCKKTIEGDILRRYIEAKGED